MLNFLNVYLHMTCGESAGKTNAIHRHMEENSGTLE